MLDPETFAESVSTAISMAVKPAVARIAELERQCTELLARINELEDVFVATTRPSSQEANQ